jgi:hypothetical protein
MLSLPCVDLAKPKGQDQNFYGQQQSGVGMKKVYEKPVLTRRENLSVVTANGGGSPVPL